MTMTPPETSWALPVEPTPPNLMWDGDGRLSEIDYPNSSTNTFSYNGLGQRVGKLDSGGTFAYTLADDAIDSNVLADGQATYQYGAGLVSEVRGSTSKVYHADSLGTTRAMSDSSAERRQVHIGNRRLREHHVSATGSKCVTVWLRWSAWLPNRR